MSIINTNISSLTAQRNLGMSQASLSTAMQRLSSGLRINSAKDDAAGLAISDRMTTQIRGSNQAARNANDGISLSQTAEGDLAQISVNLQRMRELAVQSANATNTSSDRAAIDAEVQALSAEIDRTAQNSAFNGNKLLDGSFVAQKFQVGANGGISDSITVNTIASARISQLGGVGTSFQATTVGGAATGALAAGDLTLNGIQVGATGLGVAPGQSTGSASSIVAAINTVSSSSGVTAVANTNTVTGGAATTFGAATGSIAANTFSINGISVGAINGGVTPMGQGANVAAAINAISAQTGVSATSDAASGALTLTASDGRDINIAMNGSSSAAVATTNQTTLVAQTGLATVNVGAQANPAIAGTQFSAGAFSALPAATAAGGGIAAGTITANGVSVGAVTFTTQVANTAVTAAAVAATGSTLTIGNLTAGSTYTIASTTTNVGTINLLATGVAATDAANFAAAYNVLGGATSTLTAGTGLNANVLTSSGAASTLAITAVRTATQVAAGVTSAQTLIADTSTTAAANGAGFALNAGTLGLQASGGNGYNAQQLATAIQTALTSAGSTTTLSASTAGVITTVGATPIALGLGGTAESAAIAVTNKAAAVTATGIVAANLGTQAVGGGVSNHGTITLSSTSGAGIVWGGNSATKAGLSTNGTQAATTTSTVSSIANLNVLTAENATKALAAIDGALTTVSASRAALGAIQNRFTSVVTSLQTTSENLTASRSRIQDADFAAETASLSRAQVLQQAGTAMVAQANQLPQGVLALLR